MREKAHPPAGRPHGDAGAPTPGVSRSSPVRRPESGHAHPPAKPIGPVGAAARYSDAGWLPVPQSGHHLPPPGGCAGVCQSVCLVPSAPRPWRQAVDRGFPAEGAGVPVPHGVRPVPDADFPAPGLSVAAAAWPARRRPVARSVRVAPSDSPWRRRHPWPPGSWRSPVAGCSGR